MTDGVIGEMKSDVMTLMDSVIASSLTGGEVDSLGEIDDEMLDFTSSSVFGGL